MVDLSVKKQIRGLLGEFFLVDSAHRIEFFCFGLYFGEGLWSNAVGTQPNSVVFAFVLGVVS